jgi:hypothetical protein
MYLHQTFSPFKLMINPKYTLITILLKIIINYHSPHKTLINPYSKKNNQDKLKISIHIILSNSYI